MLFRGAFLDFVLAKLHEAYGNQFWAVGIEPALGSLALSLIQVQFERRHQQPLAAVQHPDNEIGQTIGIGHFLPIVQKNWSRSFVGTFQERNKAKVEVLLGEISEVRNAVAHIDPVGDDDTLTLDNMQRLLEPIAPEVAAQVFLLKKEVWHGSFSVDSALQISGEPTLGSQE